MKPPAELTVAGESSVTSTETPKVELGVTPNREPGPAPSGAIAMTKTALGQTVLLVLGVVAFLYFTWQLILPVFLACIAGMALEPLIRWLSNRHIPPTLSAGVVLYLLVSAIGIGFFQSGRPALTWMNEAPQLMTDLRQRVQRIFPLLARLSPALASISELFSPAASAELVVRRFVLTAPW